MYLMSSPEESPTAEADDAAVVPDVFLVCLWFGLADEAHFKESFVIWMIFRHVEYGHLGPVRRPISKIVNSKVTIFKSLMHDIQANIVAQSAERLFSKPRANSLNPVISYRVLNSFCTAYRFIRTLIDSKPTYAWFVVITGRPIFGDTKLSELE